MMFCSKCGKPQPEGTQFCTSCGNPITPVETVSGASPPPTGTYVPGPPTPPYKSNTLLFVLLGVAVALLAGVVVAVILLTSPSGTQPAATTTPTYTAGSSAAADFRIYSTPAFTTGSLETVLPGSRWTLVGIATNANQAGGAEGTYSLGQFSAISLQLQFGTDGVLTTTSSYQGASLDTNEIDYVINNNYCQCDDLDIEGSGGRFYLGADGNLYMTAVTGDKEMSDYLVFARVS